jgi:ribosomal protein L12E/L44/L45/RPP1/RPP2
MLFMLNAFHVYEHGSHAGSATPSGDEDEDAKGGTEEEEEEEEEEAQEDDRTCVTGCVLQVI